MNDDTLRLMASALIDADHLAYTAERLLAASNRVAGARERFDATGYAADAVALQVAEESYSEFWRGTRSAVFEYRKRAERAREAMAAVAE